MTKTKKIATAALAAVTLVGGLAAATETSAQGRYYRGRDNTGAAVAAGIAGLALGAALSSNSRGYGGGYGYAPSYGYAYPSYGYSSGYGGYGYGYAPSYGYGYAQPYYAAPRHRGYARTCAAWRYDRWGRPFRVETYC